MCGNAGGERAERHEFSRAVVGLHPQTQFVAALHEHHVASRKVVGESEYDHIRHHRPTRGGEDDLERELIRPAAGGE